jgi:hypothetical protein
LGQIQGLCPHLSQTGSGSLMQIQSNSPHSGDARNIRNIVLMRPVNQIIEFKQIVGRGTRLFDGKEFFTIYDCVEFLFLFHLLALF